MEEINGKYRLERKREILKENKKNIKSKSCSKQKLEIHRKPEERKQRTRKYKRNEKAYILDQIYNRKSKNES